MEAQQALAAKQHIAVKERFGQFVVRVMRGTGAFVNILGEEVQLQITADFRSRPAIADPVQDDFLGRIQRCHHPTVLFGQGQAAFFHIQLTQRFEQRGLEREVLAQLAKQPRQAVLHRLVGEQRIPQHRQQSIPGRACHQQQRLLPEARRAAALLHADHAVHRENQRGRAEGGVAFAQCAEHGQGKARQRQGADEQPGVGEQKFHRIGRHAEATEGDQQCHHAALPTIISFRQGAGDDAEKQRDQRMHPALRPAQQQRAAEGDKHPQAVAEFILGPEATKRVAQRSGRHGPTLINRNR